MDSQDATDNKRDEFSIGVYFIFLLRFFLLPFSAVPSSRIENFIGFNLSICTDVELNVNPETKNRITAKKATMNVITSYSVIGTFSH